jgi:translation initiation factor 4E
MTFKFEGIRRGQMHPLQTAWTLYFQQPEPHSDDYSVTIHKIGRFETIEGFWSYFAYLKRVSDISEPFEYHLFRNEIRGLWEEEVNRDGGKWTFLIKKQYSAQYWEKTVIALIGEALHEDVVGAVIAVHESTDTLSFWTTVKRNDTNDQQMTEIAASIAKALQLPNNTRLKFKNHYETARDAPKQVFSYTVRNQPTRKSGKGGK